jgi:hypothetical protein
MKGRKKPVESELALGPEEVDVVLEDELEHELLVDVVARRVRLSNVVAQKRKARQRKVVLGPML